MSKSTLLEEPAFRLPMYCTVVSAPRLSPERVASRLERASRPLLTKFRVTEAESPSVMLSLSSSWPNSKRSG